MKTNRFTHLVAAIFGLAVFSAGGCGAKEKISETSLPSAKEVAATPAANQVAAVTIPDRAAVKWIDIKDLSYDARAQFFSGLKRLEVIVDGQISELTAKRAAMKGTTDTKDWDFAMKEMEEARTYLKSAGEDASKATAETWAQEKDKVGQAWARTQEAYSKVKSSTTS
jgi:hypothetical protein